ncbi:pyridoxamine 5'-phosphate oxidase family protein [Mucilaginibacter paludis]|uniref:Pyridoxamine 5'-phosphate oxidase-related FMN-binding protein n=1 Tax=Mucilaginibacter paludis DSM 18603 TaxID=714943 RepID=H1YAR3_9SPHI|nr:pyridoxamine 5'-phosphate oxidase family protein [Mucilaginibacter paludis]EHQ29522.1 pyridoxamine 5'-phosphate oxidase-related FMN-binding protein [Mucilaginibacter paludis DSM 18603]
MLGNLNQKEIDLLLNRQVVGRLGCHAGGLTYVVPINYAYKNGVIYAHSAPGKKIQMMRENPEVCFEVDEIDTIFRWKCVVGWGKFEEIKDVSEQEQTMQLLIHRIMPLVDTPAGHPSHGITANEFDAGVNIELIVYKIVLSNCTGRFENSSL